MRNYPWQKDLCYTKRTWTRSRITELVTVESAPLIQTRRGGGTVVPAIVAAAGDGASRRFLEFFAVTIDNPNTRAAYFHACRRFFAWCDRARYRRTGRYRADACRGLYQGDG